MATTPPFYLQHYIDLLNDLNDPWDLTDYLDAGLTKAAARDWTHSWVYPPWARAFAEGGMGPAEANHWSMAPVLAFGYQRVGLEPREAKEWLADVVWPAEAAIWRAAGYDAQARAAVVDACRWFPESSSTLQIALLWAVTGLHPLEALEHATAGTSPVVFLGHLTSAPATRWQEVDELWTSAGFSGSDAEGLCHAYWSRDFRSDSLAPLWALTGLDPREALEHAVAGTCPTAFLGYSRPAHGPSTAGTV